MILEFFDVNVPNRTVIENTYIKNFRMYEAVLADIMALIEASMKLAGLHNTVKGRVKSFSSYYKKLLDRLRSSEHKGALPRITDILGIRIVCPFLEDLHKIEACLRETFKIIETEHKGADRPVHQFGYDSTHFLIEIPKSILEKASLHEECECEIQIRTLLQDAWAEVEHELIYKAEFSPYDEPLKRKLAALNANLTLSDIIFQEIRDYQKQLHEELMKRRASFFEQVNELNPIGEAVERKPLSEISRVQEDPNPAFLPKAYENIDDLLLKALYAHNRKKYQKAISIYTAILELNPKQPIRSLIHVHRGMAHFSESDYASALSDFSEALMYDAENQRALYYRGIVHRVLGHYDEALSDFSSAIEADPFHSDALFARAQLFAHLGDFFHAQSDCDAVLLLEPDNEYARRFLEHIRRRMRIS